MAVRARAAIFANLHQDIARLLEIRNHLCPFSKLAFLVKVDLRVDRRDQHVQRLTFVRGLFVEVDVNRICVRFGVRSFQRRQRKCSRGNPSGFGELQRYLKVQPVAFTLILRHDNFVQNSTVADQLDICHRCHVGPDANSCHHGR